jgi:flavorubredoxin
MHCARAVTEDLLWVGGNDRRGTKFEAIYEVPHGVSYNAYLLLDEKTVLFDTVDQAVSAAFFENLTYGLQGRPLDCLVVHHMEPDHAATIGDLLLRYPDVEIVCTAKAREMLLQFFPAAAADRVTVVKEGDTLCTGAHTLRFLTAPMVHWPEVMVTYDETSKTVFSADAFGVFGALNGRLFADEADFFRDYLDEARRYYANIVGKYGPQVQALLKKLDGLEIKLVCPLHGFVWRQDFGRYLDYYRLWSTYTPETKAVLIAYASVYGNTENAAEALASRIAQKGMAVELYDTSVTPAPEIIAAAFRCSHLVFAAPTYNGGIFVTMDALLRDLAAHNLQNRTVAFLENGSWMPMAGRLMRQILEPVKNTTFLEQTVSLRSSLRDEQSSDLDALADAICG